MLILSLFIAHLAAKINISTFHSHFIQKVTNDQNRTLRYEGEVWFSKQPFAIKWLYQKPHHKEIYIDASSAIIIEPELEQATFRRFDKKEDLFTLLEKAKQITPKHYVATYKDKKIDIFLSNGVIRRIRYKDRLDNLNEIVFIDPKQNGKIDGEVFSFQIPQGWDIIRE